MFFECWSEPLAAGVLLRLSASTRLLDYKRRAQGGKGQRSVSRVIVEADAHHAQTPALGVWHFSWEGE